MNLDLTRAIQSRSLNLPEPVLGGEKADNICTFHLIRHSNNATNQAVLLY